MRIDTYRARVVAIGAAAAAISGTGIGLAVTDAIAASAPLPTVTVRMSDNAITLSGTGVTKANGVYSLRAGRIHFHVVSVKGDHVLNVAHLNKGYTEQQASQDFQSFGNTKQATQNIYNGITFRGGPEAQDPKHPGDGVISLSAATYNFNDFNGQAQQQVNVTGKAPSQSQQSVSGTVTAYVYGWVTSRHLPANGWVKFQNNSDQPHVISLQQVKSSTTNADVAKFIKSGANGNPPFALKANTSTSAMSGGHQQLVHLNLPKGKYLLLCFMPDYFDNMPHFLMGMWKLVTVS